MRDNLDPWSPFAYGKRGQPASIWRRLEHAKSSYVGSAVKPMCFNGGKSSVLSRWSSTTNCIKFWDVIWLWGLRPQLRFGSHYFLWNYESIWKAFVRNILYLLRPSRHLKYIPLRVRSQYFFKGKSLDPLHSVIFLLIQVYFGAHYCEVYKMRVKPCKVQILVHTYSPCCPQAFQRKKIEKRWRLRLERALQKQGFAEGNLCNSSSQKIAQIHLG